MMSDVRGEVGQHPFALLLSVAVVLVVVPALLGPGAQQRDVVWLNMTEEDVPLQVLEVQPDRFDGMGVVRRYDSRTDTNSSTSLVAVTALTGFDEATARIRQRVVGEVDRDYADRLRFRTGNGLEHEFLLLVMYPSANESYAPPIGPARLRSIVPDAVMVTIAYEDHTETVTMPVQVVRWDGPTEFRYQ